MAQAFPPQPEQEGDIEIPDTRTSVRACEVREALFTQSVKKSPGLDGASFKALRLLWGWVEERIVAPVRGCIRKGYHPCAWKTAKSVLLRKQGKPTYAAAKAYRVISLLSCLGKVVERAVVTLIASHCETNNIFRQGQFGCRQGRGTSDAVARLVSRVEDAWDKKRTGLALLLDFKGAFDRVNKKQLLKRMVQAGIAGNTVRRGGLVPVEQMSPACDRRKDRQNSRYPSRSAARLAGVAGAVHSIHQRYVSVVGG